METRVNRPSGDESRPKGQLAHSQGAATMCCRDARSVHDVDIGQLHATLISWGGSPDRYKNAPGLRCVFDSADHGTEELNRVGGVLIPAAAFFKSGEDSAGSTPSDSESICPASA